MTAAGSDLARALTLAEQGEWEAAHTIVQADDGRIAAWIHAVLHRIEGDEGNARYWYGRAGRPFDPRPPAEELALIRRHL